MKLIKFVGTLFSSSLLVSAPIVITSCNQNQENTNKINLIKNKLNDLIQSKNDLLNNDYVSPVYNTIPETNNETFFNILSNDENNVIDVYFRFNKEQEFKLDGYITSFSFSYNKPDSFGVLLKPSISESKSSITIPVLITLIDQKSKLSATKYINLFTLNIKDTIVQDLNDKGYNGVPGKSIAFENSQFKNVQFKSVPKIMVEKYLDFILFIKSNKYKKEPIYQAYDSNQNITNDFKQWKGKTLTEVKALSNAIQPPQESYDGKGNIYKYVIKNSFFYDKERQFANFIITVNLDYSQNPKILTDAKEIYNLNFSYDYSIINKSWSFVLPSESDISSYVSENSKLLDELYEKFKDIIQLNVPEVLIDPIYAQKEGVKKIVETSKKESSFFAPPKSYINIFPNGQEREISFEISNLEEVENEENVIKINMKICIDKNDLKSTKDFSKKFNIIRWEFV